MKTAKRSKRITMMLLTVLLSAALMLTGFCAYADELPQRGLDLSALLELFGSGAGLDEDGGSSSGKTDDSGVSDVVEGLLSLLGAANVPIKDATVAKIPDQTYTGKAIRPTLKITYNGKTLKRGTDYSVTYTNNTEVGTAKCKITGKGTYTGTKTVSFKIVKDTKKKETEKSGTKETEKKSDSKTKTFKVTLSKTSYVYDGQAHKPTVTVTVRGKKVTSSNYTVSYTSNKNVGTATVKVTGKGDYKGYSGTATFKITMKKAVISSAKSTDQGEAVITWKKDTQADGYQLEYCTNKAFSSNVKKKSITSGKTVTLTLTGLTSGKNCYVRVRAYKKIGSRNQYGEWSTVKSFKVK